MKGIQPTVATVLLITIVVVSVVGMYYWMAPMTSKPRAPTSPSWITANILGGGKLLLANLGSKSLNISSLELSDPNVALACEKQVLGPKEQTVCTIEGNPSSEEIAIYGPGLVPVKFSSGELFGSSSSSWGYHGWSYRRPINISSSTSLANYQVLVSLNSSNFDFSKAREDGRDIRFTWVNDGNEQTIPYWIEYWNSTSEEARVWIKVPSLSPGNNRVYMYYGNSHASSTSDINSVFSSWTQTTDTDFNSGTLENLTVSGTGTEASLEISSGSGWTKACGTSGYEEGYSLVKEGNNLLVAGKIGGQALLAKLDSSGNLDWTMGYTASSYDYINDVIPVPDGYLLAMYSEDTNMNPYAVVLKVNTSGYMEWNKMFGTGNGDEAISLTETTDGYLVTGKTTSYTSGGNDIFLAKLNSSGDLDWFKTYGWSSQDIPSKIINTSDGGYVIVGRTSSSTAGGYDVLVMKLDQNGNVIWTRKLGTPNADYGNSVVETKDNGFLVVGSTLISTGNTDVLVLKINSTGDLEWAKTYGGTSYDEAYDVIGTDNGYLITGYTYVSGNSRVLIMEINSTGDLEWAKALGNGGDRGEDIIKADNGYMITGYISGGAGNHDALLVYLPSSGDIPGCSWITSVTLSESDISLTVNKTNLSPETRNITPQTQTLTSSGQSLTTTVLCQGGYTSGTIVSSTLDTVNPCNPVWLEWSESLPSGTDVRVQLAGNNDGSSWSFVGPDGSSGSYYTDSSGERIWSGLKGNRYLKYKVYLSTSDSSVTPSLEDITLYYGKYSSPEPTVTLGPEETA